MSVNPNTAAEQHERGGGKGGAAPFKKKAVQHADQCARSAEGRQAPADKGAVLPLIKFLLLRLLARFEEQQMIRETGSQGRKRYYMITDKGISMLRAEYARLQALVEDGSACLGSEKGDCYEE